MLIVNFSVNAQVGVGVKAPKGAEVSLMAVRKCFTQNGPTGMGRGWKHHFLSKWQIVNDPVDKGTVVSSNDPAAGGRTIWAADIVTKKESHDFPRTCWIPYRQPGGNSGVYLQNRYEIQILDVFTHMVWCRNQWKQITLLCL